MDAVTAWREAIARGIAGELCDRIIASRPIPDKLLSALGRQALPCDEANLTLREREVLLLAALGWRDHHIAEALYISPITAKRHVRNALARLGARNRSHLVAIAIRRGLI